MYDLDSRDHYYTVVDTIADAARRNDPSPPNFVAEHVLASSEVMGEELATRHSAQPYAAERLVPTEVLMYSDVGTHESPLPGGDQELLKDMTLREKAVYVLARDLRENAGYTGE